MELIRSLGCRPGNGKKSQSWALYRCPFCLKEFELQRSHGQRNRSCGCAKNQLCSDAKTSHGSARRGKKTRLYKIWCKINERCNNPNSSRYPYYGAKGITVCEGWREFAAFEAWALQNGYRETLEIDREKGHLGYSPDNCRWTTRTHNNRNRSMVKLTMTLARSLREAYATSGKSIQWAADKYQVSKGCAADVISGKTWKEGTTHGDHQSQTVEGAGKETSAQGEGQEKAGTKSA